MLALPPHPVTTGKLWFESLPARTRQIIVAVAAGIIALVLLSVIWNWYHHSRPEYVLEVLDSLHFPAEVERNSDYFTPEGKSVWLWMMSNADHSTHSGEKLIISDPVITGNICEFSGRCGEGTFKIRLVKTSRWHSMIFTSTRGRTRKSVCGLPTSKTIRT